MKEVGIPGVELASHPDSNSDLDSSDFFTNLSYYAYFFMLRSTVRANTMKIFATQPRMCGLDGHFNTVEFSHWNLDMNLSVWPARYVSFCKGFTITNLEKRA